MDYRIFVAAIFAVSLQGCGNATGSDENGTAYPSDKQVIEDVSPKNDDGFIEAEVSKSGKGEAYQKDLQWYYDRGVIVKRKANLAGLDDAVLLVGGLARYQLVGNSYKYARFLTTYNEYEGIPKPKVKQLEAFTKDNLAKIFVSREHNIMAVDEIEMLDEPWVWHNPNSFTIPFSIEYKERVNNSDLEKRLSKFDLRFYRSDFNEPVNNLMATEGDRKSLGRESYTPNELDQMKNLRTGF